MEHYTMKTAIYLAKYKYKISAMTLKAPLNTPLETYDDFLAKESKLYSTSIQHCGQCGYTT
jgi:hypothetical protein